MKFLNKYRVKRIWFLTLFFLIFTTTVQAQIYPNQISNWQIMRSTDKLSNHSAIRKFMPKGLDGKWTAVKETSLLSNIADWARIEAKLRFKPWTIPWSTWILKAPLFDSVTVANGLNAHYKLRLNRLECAELEVYINEHKLNIVNPTFGQTFIDQLIDITPYLKRNGKDTIFVGFISQMTQGLTMQKTEHNKFPADNETTADSIEQLYYGGFENVEYDGRVKISPYFRRPILDFGWDFAKPNIRFGLGGGIEVIGWNDLIPTNSHVTTDSIIYDAKGIPVEAYVTFHSEFDADFTKCKTNYQYYWTPSFDYVVERNYSQKYIPPPEKKGKKALTVIQNPDDWERMDDSTFELIENGIEGLRYDSASHVVITTKFRINKPKLWYPNGYFKQFYPKDELPSRYRFGVQYTKRTSYQGGYNGYYGNSLFLNSPFYTSTGIRTIEVDTQKGKFQFVVNKKKIMALGSNVVWNRENLNQWVEGAHPFLSFNYHGITPYYLSSNKPFEYSFYGNYNILINPKVKYVKPRDKQFRAMFNLGMNMVRFWGGGNYPPEEVFQECDKLGILVWQDLMYSGTTYPSNNEWNESVGNEINHTVTWMKAHPSLALICGNNEIEVALKNWGWQQKYNIHGVDSMQQWNSYRYLFDTFIPRKLQNIDTTIFYLPSSPIGNWGNLKQMSVGDNHDWGIWHGERNFNHVDSVNAPFVSEFGFPSLPRGYKESVDSLKYYSLDFRSYKGFSLLNRYVKTEINNRNKYLVFPPLNMSVLTSTRNSISGKTQALFLDRAIRAYRTSSADFGGCLFWQWNDVDRVVSWSLVDADMNNKPAFEQLKYSLKPIVVFARCTDTSIRISAQSISLKTQKFTVKVYIMSPKKIRVYLMQKPITINGFSEFTLKVQPAILKVGNTVHVQLTDLAGKVIDEI